MMIAYYSTPCVHFFIHTAVAAENVKLEPQPTIALSTQQSKK